MSKSESIKELTGALAKAQIAFKPIKRTERVGYDTTKGRKQYNYAPLNEVIEATKQALSDNGLAITQSTKLVEGNTVLETLLSHSSGEWLSGELYVGKQDQPPQSEGSSLTYKRRYGMSAMLCIASEDDDDAEAAMKPTPRLISKPKADIEELVVVAPKKEPQTAGGMLVDDLYQFIAENMKWKTPNAARTWIVNKMKIAEDRIDTETEAVYNEIKQLQGWD